MPFKINIGSFGLMISVLVSFLVTGCDDLNRGKTDAEIAIDLSAGGQSFPKQLYGALTSDLNRPAQSGADTGNLKSALNLAADMVARENRVATDSSFNLNMNYLQRSIHAPVYYVLKLFTNNQPDSVMPVKVGLKDVAGKAMRVAATAGIHEKSGIVIIKLVNREDRPARCRIVLNYKKPVKYKGEVIVLTSGSMLDVNSLKEPEKVVPMTRDLNGLRNNFNYTCPAHAFVIIHLRYKKGINGFVDCC